MAGEGAKVAGLMVRLACICLGVLLAFGPASVWADPPRRHRNAPRHAQRHRHHGHHRGHHGGHRHPRVDLAAYRSRVRAWHDPATVPAPRTTPDGRTVLRVVSLNTRASAEVVPATPEGGFDEAACREVSRVLSDARTHAVTEIDRRLIEVVYGIARHFGAGQVSVVSGYRAGARRSNHRLGRAVDLVIPGVSDTALAAYARTLGMLGVGMYPVSGFVHLDVRERSFFWVDRSAPGRRSRRLHEVEGEQARRADEAARARGVSPFGGTSGGTDPASDGADAEDGADEDDGAGTGAQALPR